jgi:uncharacterized membrane protein YfcA
VAFGLVKRAYVGTEALCAAVTHLFKLVGYGEAGVLSGQALLTGSLLGGFMVIGAAVGKRLLNRVSPTTFVRLVQVTLVVAGVRLLLR